MVLWSSISRAELAGELDRLQAAPERPPEAALEEALDLLLDVAQEAHAIGPRSVADALAGARRRRTRQGRRAHATTTSPAGTRRRGRSRPAVAAATSDARHERPSTRAAATARGRPGRARSTSGHAHGAAPPSPRPGAGPRGASARGCQRRSRRDERASDSPSRVATAGRHVSRRRPAGRRLRRRPATPTVADDAGRRDPQPVGPARHQPRHGRVEGPQAEGEERGRRPGAA